MSLAKIFLVVALVWFTYRLLRSRRDPALGAVVGCLLLKLFGAPSTILAVHAFFGNSLDVGMVKLAQNIVLDVSWFLLLVFFIFSAGGSRRRVGWEAVVLLGVCAATAISMFATPADLRVHYGAGAGLPWDLHEPAMACFYLVDNGYAAYVTVQAAVWAFRDASESASRVRWGLRIAGVGLVSLALSAIGRLIVVVVRWSGGTVPTATAASVDGFVSLGVLLFMAGVTLVGVSAVLVAAWVWARHRRRYHALRPLWEQLHEAFPDDALYSGPRSVWLERLSLWRVHRRYWRRVIEIRDGLVQLSPHLVDCGFSADGPSRPLQGEMLREALARRKAGTPPRSSHAVLVAQPERPDFDADVDQLVRLSDTLRV